MDLHAKIKEFRWNDREQIWEINIQMQHGIMLIFRMRAIVIGAYSEPRCAFCPNVAAYHGIMFPFNMCSVCVKPMKYIIEYGGHHHPVLLGLKPLDYISPKIRDERFRAAGNMLQIHVMTIYSSLRRLIPHDMARMIMFWCGSIILGEKKLKKKYLLMRTY